MASLKLREALKTSLNACSPPLTFATSRLGSPTYHALSSYRCCSPRAFSPTRGIFTQSVPTVFQPSFWKSLLPKPLRRGSQAASGIDEPKKGWNPATFFIIISTLIGSQAIQTVALRQDHANFSQQTEEKLTLLRQVVKRIRNGEDVDVEGILGTGDKAKEKEWEEVMRELEDEDSQIRSRKRRRKHDEDEVDRAQDKARD